jgi:hypothetical protein
VIGKFIALSAGAVLFNQPLESLVDGLNRDADAVHAHQIVAAIASSPSLTRELGDLAADGRLKGVQVGAVTGRYGATHQSGVIRLSPDFIDAQKPASGDLSQATQNLIFVLGYEASKVATASAEDAAEEQSMARLRELFASTPKGTSPDVTGFVREQMNLKSANEAQAYLQGWNDVLDAIVKAQEHKLTADEVLQSLRAGRNTKPLLAAAMLPEGERMQPDAHFRFPANARNLKAVMAVVGQSAVPDFM